MRKVREILRLRWGVGLSQRQTARSLSISSSAVCECIRRAREAGLSWPLSSELDDVELETRLYRTSISPVPKATPDWSQVHREMRRKGVTLQLLWQEYREGHATDGYSYSQYCDLYRRYRGKLDVVLRHEHRAGEKLFVDYAGDGVSIVDPRTGEVTRAELFVAVLGASSYLYAEATPSQRVPDWIQSHIRAFEFFGGVTEVTVPDQLKSGVSRSCRYEPQVQRTYEEMAQHYGTVIIGVRCTSARTATRASSRSLSTALTRRRCRPPLPRLRNHFRRTPTCAEPGTTSRKENTVLHEQTHEKLVQMRLRGMAAALQQSLEQPAESDLTFEDRLGLMVDREWNERQDRSLQRRLQIAKLREPACMEDVNYRHPRQLDKSVFQRLATCQWIRSQEGVIFTGPTGVGKTWLACALGNQACREGFSVVYRRLSRLLHQLRIARADGSYAKELARLARIDVLILDDWGLAVLEDEERRDLLEVLEDRRGLRSTIVTSQLPVAQWHDTIGDPTIADSILDRVVHQAHRIELDGASLRKAKKQAKQEGNG